MPLRSPALSLAAALAALMLAGCMGQRAGNASTSERATTPSRDAAPAATPAPTSPPQALPAEGPLASAPGASGAPVLASAAPGSTVPAAAAPSLAPPVPPGMLYVCARVVDGAPRHTGIDYEPKVRELCARHPEMSVCQYAREACRRDGGRVFDARGLEITKQLEAEYDRKVMRARFRAG
jgi:hypothetical protein